MGEITRQGDPPYRLASAQPASSRAVRGSVEMTVYVSVHLQPPGAFQIQIPMSIDEARQVLADLQVAIWEAEKRWRRR
jgi:hypothetical protein